jgi:hypothetical protein
MLSTNRIRKKRKIHRGAQRSGRRSRRRAELGDMFSYVLAKAFVAQLPFVWNDLPTQT